MYVNAIISKRVMYIGCFMVCMMRIVPAVYAAQSVQSAQPAVAHNGNLKEKVADLCTAVRAEENRFKQRKERHAKKGYSTMAIATTALYITAGLTPLVAGSQSRFTEPFAPFIMQPLMKYGLLALGWIGSLQLTRMLFPSPSQKTVERRLNQYQTFISSVVQDVSEIEKKVTEQAEFIATQQWAIDHKRENNAVLEVDLKRHAEVLSSIGNYCDRLSVQVNAMKAPKIAADHPAEEAGRELPFGHGRHVREYETIYENMKNIIREMSYTLKQVQQNGAPNNQEE